MTAPPRFASIQGSGSCLGDVGSWWPCVAEFLDRRGLAVAGREPVAGLAGTDPAFLHGDVVVKSFGFPIVARESRGRTRGADPGRRR